MACNFKILIHQNEESIHLKLMGDFDGSSACELINALKTYSKKANRVFIHSDGLKQVHPFGASVFRSNFHEVSKANVRFIVTGKNGKSLNRVISRVGHASAGQCSIVSSQQ
jgi:anti-anti-sigma regulatory factor